MYEQRFIDDFFKMNMQQTREEDSLNYQSIYEKINKEKKPSELSDLKKVLLSTIELTKERGEIQNPEYFFKFISLLPEEDREELLKSIRLEIFPKNFAEDVINSDWLREIKAFSDIYAKISEILSSEILEAGDGPIIGVTIKEDNDKIIGLSVKSDDQQELKIESFEICHSDPKIESFDIVNNLNKGDALEDHMFFDNKSQVMKKDLILDQNMVKKVKYECSNYSYPDSNAFGEHQITKIVTDQMSSKNAVDGIVATASNVYSDSNPNLKRVDTLLIGDSHDAFIKLTVRVGENKKIWRLIPGEPHKLFDENGQEIQIGGLKNIKIPQLVKYKNLEDAKEAVSDVDLPRDRDQANEPSKDKDNSKRKTTGLDIAFGKKAAKLDLGFGGERKTKEPSTKSHVDKEKERKDDITKTGTAIDLN